MPLSIKQPLFAIAPDGSEHTDAVAVDTARESGGDWQVAVRIAGLANEKQVHGVDAEHARSLAVSFAHSIAEHFEQKGWRYYAERGGERVHMASPRPDS